MNALKSLPVTGGSHLPEEAKQRQHRKQHRQRDQCVSHINKPQRQPVFVGAGGKALLQLNGHIQLHAGKIGRPVGSVDDLGALRQGSHDLLAGGQVGHGNAVAAFRRAAVQQPVPQRFLVIALVQPANHISHYIACLAFIQQLLLCVGG